jgi:hypothetical protein
MEQGKLRKTVNTLDMVEAFKLKDWMEKTAKARIESGELRVYASIAAAATRELGFTVTDNNVRMMVSKFDPDHKKWPTLGLTIGANRSPDAMKAATDRIAILESQVRFLAEQLGVTLPSA